MKKFNLLKILSILLYVFYVLSIIYFIVINKYNYAAICFGCMIATIVLKILNNKLDYLFNDMITIVFDLFICFSLVLGTCYGLYKINHYDDVLHILSGVISGIVAYMIINSCTKKEDRRNIKKIFFIIFIFMFNMGIANLWEIVEFTLDIFFKINTQAGGLKDTMIDMVDALVGTIIIIPFLLRKL